MTFQVVDGSQFTHLSTDLPLPTGSGVPRGATSQELDTGRVLRYEYASQTWYAVSGTSTSIDTGNTFSSSDATAQTTEQRKLADEFEQRALLGEIRDYVRAIAHGIAILVDADDVDGLVDDSGPSQ